MDLGISELTAQQIEDASGLAENAARKNIFSKISQKKVETLNISVEAEGTRPVSFTVEVDLTLASEVKGINQKALAEGAVKEAFAAIEKYLRTLK